MSLRTSAKIVLYLAVSLVICGCVVTQEIYLQADGTGAGKAVITMDPIVTRYLDSILDAIGDVDKDAPPTPLFNVEQIVAAMEAREGIDPVLVTIADRHTLVVEYRISDFETAFGGIAELEQTGNSNTKLTMHIDRTTFPVLSGLFLTADSPVSLFVPVSEYDFLSVADYTELAEYALADYAVERSIKEILNDSRVVSVVRSDTEIVDASPAAFTPEEATFDLLLIELVTLEEPVQLHLEWR